MTDYVHGCFWMGRDSRSRFYFPVNTAIALVVALYCLVILSVVWLVIYFFFFSFLPCRPVSAAPYVCNDR